MMAPPHCSLGVGMSDAAAAAAPLCIPFGGTSNVERLRGAASRLVAAMVGTAVNFALLAIRMLLGQDGSREVRWGIVREALLVFWLLAAPALGGGLRGRLDRKRWIAGRHWGDALLASLSAWTRFAVAMVSVLVMLAVFPDSLDDNYLHRPWSFFTSYLLIILAIYCALTSVGSMIVSMAALFYEDQAVRTRVTTSLHNAIALATLIQYTATTRSSGGGAAGGFVGWRRRLRTWASTRSHMLGRRRLLALEDVLSMADLDRLAADLWEGYEETRRNDSTLRWIDHISAIAANAWARQGGRRRGVAIPDQVLFDEATVTSRDSLKSTLDQMLRGIQDAAEAVQANDRLFAQLERCFTIGWLVIIAIVILPVLGFTPNSWLLPMGVSVTPSLLALTVIFGTPTAEGIEAIIFTFYRHPFDVGDEVRIEGATYTIKHIGILASTMETSLNMRVYYPTTLLMQKPIANISRSPTFRQQVVMALPSHVSNATVAEARDSVLWMLRQKFASAHRPSWALVSAGAGRSSEVHFMVEHPNAPLSSADLSLSNAKQMAPEAILHALQTSPSSSSLVLQTDGEVQPLFLGAFQARTTSSSGWN